MNQSDTYTKNAEKKKSQFHLLKNIDQPTESFQGPYSVLICILILPQSSAAAATPHNSSIWTWPLQLINSTP